MTNVLKKMEAVGGVKWTIDAISALVDICKSNVCLYDAKSLEYRNRERAGDYQEEMANAVKPIIANITCIYLFLKCKVIY